MWATKLLGSRAELEATGRKSCSTGGSVLESPSRPDRRSVAGWYEYACGWPCPDDEVHIAASCYQSQA
ncbi:MAG: hypothetical protein ACYDH5_20010 [Acidimicrobiales bacterium]